MPAEGAFCRFLRAGLSAHPASLAALRQHIYHFAVIEKGLRFRSRRNAVPRPITFLRISCPPNRPERPAFQTISWLRIKDLRAPFVSTRNATARDGAGQGARHSSFEADSKCTSPVYSASSNGGTVLPSRRLTLGTDDEDRNPGGTPEAICASAAVPRASECHRFCCNA
jgi:hypothetical protein